MKKVLAGESGRLMDVKGVDCFGCSFVFTQDPDSEQDGDEGQEIRVFTENVGGGPYIVFETKRWAIDADDIDRFAAALKRIVVLAEENK